MRTNVYIDGFNLYYGLFASKKRRLPWKWLDLEALCTRLLPRPHSLNRIRYFTADVVPRPNDPHQTVRQQTYLRALSTVACLTIHKGTFLTHPKSARVQQPVSVPRLQLAIRGECVDEVRRALRGLAYVNVQRTEEKGSDVNLASHLMLDVATGDCEAVMLISNDSDLTTPLQLVHDTWNCPVIFVNPQPGRPTVPLQRIANIYRHIRPEVVRSCQFPAQIIDAHGRTIHKPAKWADDERRYLERINRS